MPRVSRVRAVTGGFAALGVAFGEGAGQQILRQSKAAEQLELPLSPAGRLGTFGISVHLVVIMLQDNWKYKS